MKLITDQSIMKSLILNQSRLMVSTKKLHYHITHVIGMKAYLIDTWPLFMHLH